MILHYSTVLWLAGALLIMVSGCDKQPIERLERAKEALADAGSAGAVNYADSLYTQAESLLTRGQLEIARQNGRFIIFRNYQRAESLLSITHEVSLMAAAAAMNNKLVLHDSAGTEVSHLKTELSSWRDAFDNSLILYKAEEYWSAADLARQVAETLIARDEFALALAEVGNARFKLRELGKLIEDYSNNQGEKIQAWRGWVRQTVDNSIKNNRTAIIVVKTAHRLYLIRAGKIIKSYKCELGYNSARQKYFAGDGATPEGKYIITSINKKGSKFYKALMLDYPNETDRKRFRQNKARGIISKYAKIGALIEIHGHGGESRDWTDGCIALTDEDIDDLIGRVSVGTPVTIVRVSDQWPR